MKKSEVKKIKLFKDFNRIIKKNVIKLKVIVVPLKFVILQFVQVLKESISLKSINLKKNIYMIKKTQRSILGSKKISKRLKFYKSNNHILGLKHLNNKFYLKKTNKFYIKKRNKIKANVHSIK